MVRNIIIFIEFNIKFFNSTIFFNVYNLVNSGHNGAWKTLPIYVTKFPIILCVEYKTIVLGSTYIDNTKIIPWIFKELDII